MARRGKAGFRPLPASPRPLPRGDVFILNGQTGHFVTVGRLEVTGTGLLTGATYRAHTVVNNHNNFSVSRLPTDGTTVVNVEVFGPPGSGLVALIHETTHLTFNANGVLTVAFD